MMGSLAPRGTRENAFGSEAVTRKKTTTGTMGSKRKTETKAKDKPVEKAVPPKRAEHKANEVIPEVAVALLETHPSLPDQAFILEEFSEHFRSASTRAEALASAIAAAAKASPVAPEGDKQQRAGERKRRPTAEPPSPRLSPRATSAYEPPAAVLASAPAAAPLAAVAAIEEEPATALVAAEPEPEMGSLFAELEAEATREPEDLFALLAADPTVPRAADDDFDFSYQTAADQSSPFLTAPMPAAEREESATTMISAVEDDESLGTPIAQEALPAEADVETATTLAPNESTMMIQAMPDDEPAEADSGAGRKSRKSSKKRRG